MFDFKIQRLDSELIHFEVKDKYLVRRDAETNEWTCTCMGETFRISGKKQNECKHIRTIKKKYKNWLQEKIDELNKELHHLNLKELGVLK